MSIISNQTESSLATFLAQNAGNSVRPTDSSADHFTESFERAMQGLGLNLDEVSVSEQTNGPNGVRQFLITVGGGSDSGGDASPISDNASAGEVVGGYDPTVGPTITKEMWTEEMLSGELPNELLLNVKDKADFLKARLDRVQSPTSAVVKSDHDSTTSPLNGSFLSTREQAEQVRELLANLGINPGEVREIGMGGPFSVDWRGEDRRQFMVADRNVGLVLERYAKYPKEVADQMMRDEFSV